jgi:hypothetical protein
MENEYLSLRKTLLVFLVLAGSVHGVFVPFEAKFSRFAPEFSIKSYTS